ncbi:MAG: PadR family transcriptional regulator [Candidatus Freyarchaeota archaeon]|nr:PadR family transcriptional regulator [Candidatus Jordarchaeia archaeon]MBS7270003.1 PadR family transcriptional regulator [Candidatus Jordarchaeia archaeon]MBS7281098.1 PadR family transcriptional regulator [Candidatus Jordarchaeia archaeon]
MSKKSLPQELVENWKRQLRKGILELAALSSVAEEEVHGYALINRLKEYGIPVTSSTIYPILQRLTENNLIESRWAEFDQGHPRKYYRITEQGKLVLAELREEWRNFTNLINSLILKEKR